jgi:chromosome segregation ATPase
VIDTHDAHDERIAELEDEKEELQRSFDSLRKDFERVQDKVRLGAEIIEAKDKEIEWLRQRYVELVDHSEAEVKRLRAENEMRGTDAVDLHREVERLQLVVESRWLPDSTVRQEHANLKAEVERLTLDKSALIVENRERTDEVERLTKTLIGERALRINAGGKSIAELEGRVERLTTVAKGVLEAMEQARRVRLPLQVSADDVAVLRAALANEGVSPLLDQPDPPLWQQDVVRSKGMCGALVRGSDGREAVCILSPGHDPAHPVVPPPGSVSVVMPPRVEEEA